MEIVDIEVLNTTTGETDKAPFNCWARVVGNDYISVTSNLIGMNYKAQNLGNKVYVNMPIRKGDSLTIEGDFEWGKFYKVPDVLD